MRNVVGIVALAAKVVPAMEEAASPPALYWVLWAVIGLIVVLLIMYVIRGRGRHEYEGFGLFAVVISFLALLAFAISMSEAVGEYAKHEPFFVGIGRFLAMVVGAALLVYYAVKGRHEH